MPPVLCVALNIGLWHVGGDISDAMVVLPMPDYNARRLTMVDTQVRPADVTKFPIIDAMMAVPREAYVPDDKREVAYVGENIELSRDRVMLDPRSQAKMLDALDIVPTDVILDLGCGLGYSTALLARLGETVVAVEQDPEMAAEAQRNLSEQGVDNAAVIAGDLNAGAAKHGPYDVIIIEGAVQRLPKSLTAQLRDGGRIGCIFMEGALGVARIGHCLNGHISWRYAFNASAPVVPGFELEQEFVF